jgi:hypothetical protein
MTSRRPAVKELRSCALDGLGASCGLSSLPIAREDKLSRLALVGPAPDCGAPRGLALAVSQRDRPHCAGDSPRPGRVGVALRF